MSYKLLFRREAFSDLQLLRISRKQDYSKCFDLILAIIKEPRFGIGRPERLKYTNIKFEIYSRRINEKDRLIYLIDEEHEIIEIISVSGHYNDK